MYVCFRVRTPLLLEVDVEVVVLLLLCYWQFEKLFQVLSGKSLLA